MNNINSELTRLIENQKDNFPLEQKFFTDKQIFEEDFKHIFSNQWVFIGHISRIPNKGDFFITEIANESIIVVRDRGGDINCFYNVCRHRGSHICTKTEGSLRKLVCPYHAWTYNLDGSLSNASMMDDNFKKEEWSLIKCNKNIFEGLIFINLSNKPSDFNEFISPLKPFISLHGLGKSKIALRKVYEIEGNWKLALDNFHECYHCHPSHPEYCDVHSKDYIQSYGAGSNTGPESLSFKTLLNDWNKKKPTEKPKFVHMGDNHPYPNAPKEACREYAEELGFEVLSVINYTLAPGDFTAQCLTVKRFCNMFYILT